MCVRAWVYVCVCSFLWSPPYTDASMYYYMVAKKLQAQTCAPGLYDLVLHRRKLIFINYLLCYVFTQSVSCVFHYFLAFLP